MRPPDYPLDCTNDGGDSTVRAGVLLLCQKSLIDVSAYEIKPGVFVRHPDQIPWCNPRNWTRDQMIPFIAGLSRSGNYQPIRRFFYQRLKSFFFMQNTERDHSGSTKYPWPHVFTNDRGQTERRWFDFADPLLPQHIWHIIVAGRMWWFYWFAPAGYLFLLLDLVVHSLSPWTWEENQMISMCATQGRPWLNLYRTIHPRWRHNNLTYWTDRNQPEYAQMLQELVEG